jgi:type II secretory pathway component GspD/PulD (secretin)
VLSAPLNVTNLFQWAGGLGAMRIAITGTEMLLQGSKSDVKALLRTDARSVDGQPVNIHIGDKYPLVTMTFAGGSVDNAQSYIPPPLFQFEDLGLTLKVTPKVHGDAEVTLDIEAEFKALAGGGINGIPIISTRKFINRAPLKFGQEAVIAGLMSAEEGKDLAGFAGLGDVPIIGPLTALNTWSKKSGQTLLVIRPRLIDTPSLELAAHSIWTGTESRPKSPI